MKVIAFIGTCIFVFSAWATPDNPRCSDFGSFDHEIKIEDGSYNGAYGIPGGTLILSSDGYYLNWSSNVAISLILMKGGNGANPYHYNPPAYSDNGLICPVNGGGNTPEISHITFCYDAPVVTTTTTTTTSSSSTSSSTSSTSTSSSTSSSTTTTTTTTSSTTTTTLPPEYCPTGWKDIYLPNWVLNDRRTTYWRLVNSSSSEAYVKITYYNMYGDAVLWRNESLAPKAILAEDLRETGLIEEYGYIKYHYCGELWGDYQKKSIEVGGFCDPQSSSLGFSTGDKLVELKKYRHSVMYYNVPFFHDLNSPAYTKSEPQTYLTSSDPFPGTTMVFVLRPDMTPDRKHTFEGYDKDGQSLGSAKIWGMSLTAFDVNNLFGSEDDKFTIPAKTAPRGWITLNCGNQPCIICTTVTNETSNQSVDVCR